MIANGCSNGTKTHCVQSTKIFLFFFSMKLIKPLLDLIMGGELWAQTDMQSVHES